MNIFIKFNLRFKMKKLIQILSIITLALASEFLEETLTQVLGENETV